MGKSEFQAYLEKVAEDFKNLPEDTSIHLTSNLDADGISAGAIMVKALKRLGMKHAISIIHQLREEELLELKEKDADFYIFTDLGSGSLDLIDRVLKGKQCLVLDHHHPTGTASNVWHVNPHLFGLDGSNEVSASGVVFNFCITLDKDNEDMAYIALVGAIGDVQEDNGFTGLNDDILTIAVESEQISVFSDLNLFGMQARPIHKLLEYGSDLNIPGVTGSESGAIQFLQELRISPKNGNHWRLYDELDKDEKQRLIAGIVMKRNELASPEEIFSNRYVITTNVGPFRELKEFSTLMNACGRMGKAIVGLGACLGDEQYKSKALQIHKEYKSEIVGAINWFYNGGKDEVIKGSNYIIINAEDKVNNTIIGTLASILAKGRDFEDGTFILSLARKPDGITKVSLRVVGNPEGVNLREMVAEMANSVGGEAGGHQFAAGAIIATDKELEFIDAGKAAFAKA